MARRHFLARLIARQVRVQAAPNGLLQIEAGPQCKPSEGEVEFLPVKEPMAPLNDADFAGDFAGVVELVIRGERTEAARKLQLIPGSFVPLAQGRSAIPLDLQVSVFRRDGFTCRYCGRRTVFCPLLRLIASIFPREFPYHAHWKMTDCHIAFWRDASSCDHLIPVARGGSSDLANLVTACYMCNSIKQNWLKEELRWMLLPAPSDSWDGLALLYLELLNLAPEQGRSAYHRNWRNALGRSVGMTTRAIHP